MRHTIYLQLRGVEVVRGREALQPQRQEVPRGQHVGGVEAEVAAERRQHLCMCRPRGAQPGSPKK
jgi:hypothetical protein